MQQDSLSVIVPALNEARHLAGTVAEISRAAVRCFERHEIIIVNDGSTDRTGEVAEKLRGERPDIVVLHHERPLNLGGAFKAGLAVARMHFVTRVNGKFDTTVDQLAGIWEHKGRADLIIPYASNATERHVSRRIVSGLFTAANNLLFGLRLRYYNHFVLHRRSDLNAISLRSSSYAFQAEILIKLLRLGRSFLEVPHHDKLDNEGATKAFRPGNLWGVTQYFALALYDVHLSGKYARRRTGTVAANVGGEA